MLRPVTPWTLLATFKGSLIRFPACRTTGRKMARSRPAFQVTAPISTTSLSEDELKKLKVDQRRLTSIILANGVLASDGEGMHTIARNSLWASHTVIYFSTFTTPQDLQTTDMLIASLPRRVCAALHCLTPTSKLGIGSLKPPSHWDVP
jgi:hypothetical protein